MHKYSDYSTNCVSWISAMIWKLTWGILRKKICLISVRFRLILPDSPIIPRHNPHSKPCFHPWGRGGTLCDATSAASWYPISLFGTGPVCEGGFSIDWMVNDVRGRGPRCGVHGGFLHTGEWREVMGPKQTRLSADMCFCFSCVESNLFCCTSTAATAGLHITKMSVTIHLWTENLIKYV